MNMLYLIVGSIIFIVVGIVFLVVAVLLGRPSSVEKASTSKPASIIFYALGALTLASGIFALACKEYITRSMVQLFAIIYLAIVTLLFGAFTLILKPVNLNGTADVREEK